MKNILIFTDLDGTLLNHHDYSFADATKAIDQIKEREIPLIIVTSKTFPEVVELQAELGISQPFIVENGAGIFIPSSSVLAKDDWHKEEGEWIKISQAKSYLESRLFLNSVKNTYGIKGFGDMDATEIVSLTGLRMGFAKNAQKRDFTEPFIIENPNLIPELTQKANDVGFDIVQGGRFYHLITLDQDKAKAMANLTLLYEEYYQRSFKSIALGDSANDFTMIEKADFGVLIPKPDGSYAPFGADHIKAPYPGPQGWNSAILELLNEN